MALTPLLMTAAQGLLQNTALKYIPYDDSYVTTTAVTKYQAALSFLNAREGAGDIAQSVVDYYYNAFANNVPFLTGQPGTSGSFSIEDIYRQHAENLFPTGNEPATPIQAPDTYANRIANNNRIFAAYIMIASGRVETVNKYINSAVNGATHASQTYTSQDALMSGNFYAVSSNPNAWGQELINSGQLYNFKQLDSLGTPQAIIDTLIRVNMLGNISDELTVQGIDVVTLTNTIRGNPDAVLSPLVQSRCYNAFLTVTGEKLDDILEVMQFTTSGISTLADLLDLRKVFPTTYSALLAPNNGTPEPIYSGTALATFVAVTDPPLASVIPADVAKANSAFSCSLKQITNITNSTPNAIGSEALYIEDLNGLNTLQALTQALDPTVSTYFQDQYAKGAGPNGTFSICEFVGAPANLPDTSSLATIINNLDTAGALDDLYLVLDAYVSITEDDPGPGDYTINVLRPDSTPYANPYGSYTSAINAIHAELDLAIADLLANYPTEVAAGNAEFESSVSNIEEGVKQLWEASIRFHTTYVTGYETKDTVNPPAQFISPWVNGFLPDEGVVFAFVEQLHNFGKAAENNDCDIADILEAMADTTTLGGQAIIAALREGRNEARLVNAGVLGDNKISDQP